ncbi:hypothetical protein GGI15_003181 [Coemansia interrupta]|uniref:Uncharacterized protein n=1 Tax=Coemansia interrupta TaxID=1126814 RepID=A0A9W8HC44_9FUNG|nr:hypothetical protein GGI15_003181 [Coemansia interrupta]
MLTSRLLRGGSWSLPARLFLGISGVQTILNVSFEAHFIARLKHQPVDPNQASLYIVYDSGFIAAQLFAFMLTYAALHVRSQPLVTASTVFDILLLLFQVAQIAQNGRLLGVVALQAVSIVILVLGCAAKAWLVWKHLTREFGWQVYRALGADLKMQRMFLFHQILLSLVTLAAFFFLELWMQLATITVQSHGHQGGGWAQNILVLFVCAAVLCMCLFAAVQEFLWLMYGCIAVFAVAPAYFIYNLVAVNRKPHDSADDVYEASRKYITFFLVLLLVLDIALIAVSAVVLRTFAKGLRHRLRHFQILARGEVDLESVSDPSTDTNAGPDGPAAEKPPGSGEITHSGLSALMTTAKSSLRESSMLFRAFFSGLDTATCDPRSASGRSLHRESVAKWEQAAPGVVNPELASMFDMRQSAAAASPKSPPQVHVLGLSPHDISDSRIFDASTQFDSKSTRQGSIALALSAAELGLINGDDQEPKVSGQSAGSSAAAAAATAPLPMSSTTLAASTPPSSPQRGPLGSEVENYAADCALYNTIQRPMALRVVNVDALSDCSDRDLAASRSTVDRPGQMDTITSAMSEATSADMSARLGEISRPTLLNEGFDPPC